MVICPPIRKTASGVFTGPDYPVECHGSDQQRNRERHQHQRLHGSRDRLGNFSSSFCQVDRELEPSRACAPGRITRASVSICSVLECSGAVSVASRPSRLAAFDGALVLFMIQPNPYHAPTPINAKLAPATIPEDCVLRCASARYGEIDPECHSERRQARCGTKTCKPVTVRPLLSPRSTVR